MSSPNAHHWTYVVNLFCMLGFVWISIKFLALFNIISLDYLDPLTTRWATIQPHLDSIYDPLSPIIGLFSSMLLLHLLMRQNHGSALSSLSSVLVLAISFCPTLLQVLKAVTRSEHKIGYWELMLQLALPVACNVALFLSWLGWKWDGGYVDRWLGRFERAMNENAGDKVEIRATG